MQQHPPRNHRPRAFTLVELAAGLLVVAVIAAIGVTAFQAVTSRGRAASIDSTLRQVELVAQGRAADAVEGDGSEPTAQLFAAAGTVVIPQEEIDEGTADPVITDIGNGRVYVRRYDQCRVLVLDDTGGQGIIYDLADFQSLPENTSDTDLQAVACEPGDSAPDYLLSLDPPGTPAVAANPDTATAVQVAATPAAEAAGPGGSPGNCDPPNPALLGADDINGDGCVDLTYSPPTPPGPGTGPTTALEFSYTDPAVGGDPTIVTIEPSDGAATVTEIVTGLPDTPHDFCVVAINNAGRSTPGCDTATPSDADLTAPQPTAVPSNQALSIDWDPNPPEEQVEYYTVSHDGGGVQPPETAQTEVTQFVFTGLTNGATYTITVTAVRGPDSASGDTTGTPQANGQVLPPRNVIAAPDAPEFDDIIVTWDASDTPNIDRYDIERADNGSSVFGPLGTTAGSDLDINDDEDGADAAGSPTVDVTYSYRVRAVIDPDGTPGNADDRYSDWAGPASARLTDTDDPTGSSGVIATVHDHEGVTAVDEIVTVDSNGFPDNSRFNPLGPVPGYPYSPAGGCDDADCRTVTYPPSDSFAVVNDVEVAWTLPAAPEDRFAIRVLMNGIRIRPDSGGVGPGGDFPPDTDSITIVDVEDGDYVFEVISVDTAGNTDNGVLSNEINVDTTAPPLPVRREATDRQVDPGAPDQPYHDVVLSWDVGPSYDLTGAWFTIERCDTAYDPLNDDPFTIAVECFTDPAEWGQLPGDVDHDSNPATTAVFDPADEEHIDDTATFGWVYCYRLQTFDPADNRSWYGDLPATGDAARNDGCIVSQDEFGPDRPAPDATVTELHRALDIDWPDASNHPRQAAMDRYEIDRRHPPAPFTLWETIGFPPGNSDIVDDDSDSDLPWLDLQEYRVTGYDEAGNDAVGAPDSGTPLDLFGPVSPGAAEPNNGYTAYPLNAAPYTPTAQGPAANVTPGNGSVNGRHIDITWGVSRDDYSGLDGYTIQMSHDGATTAPGGGTPQGWTASTAIGGNIGDRDEGLPRNIRQQSWHQPGAGNLRFGTVYCYRVRAFDRAGDHPNQATDNTSRYTSAPANPTLAHAACDTPNDTVNPTVNDFIITPSTNGTEAIDWSYDGVADDFAGIDTIRVRRTFVQCESGTCPHSVGQVETVHTDTTVDDEGWPAGPYGHSQTDATPCNEVWDYELVVTDFAGRTTSVTGTVTGGGNASCQGAPVTPGPCGTAGEPPCPTDPNCPDPNFGPCPTNTPNAPTVFSGERVTAIGWSDVSDSDPDGDFLCYQVQFQQIDHATGGFGAASLASVPRAAGAPTSPSGFNQCTTDDTDVWHGGNNGNRPNLTRGFLQPGTLDVTESFRYRVRAIDATGANSPWSAWSVRAEPWDRPTPIRAFGNPATTMNYSGPASAITKPAGTFRNTNEQQLNTAVNLTWGSSTDRDDGGLDNDGIIDSGSQYRIYSQLDHCNGDGTLSGTQPTTDRNATDSTAAANWEYFYVIPVDAGGHWYLYQRDTPGMDSNGFPQSNNTGFHDDHCAFEPGWMTPEVELPIEAFHLVVEPRETSREGHPLVADRFDLARVNGDQPDCNGRAGFTVIEANQTNYNLYDDGPVEQREDFSYCQRVRDGFGNQGPYGPAETRTVLDLVNPQAVAAGTGQLNVNGQRSTTSRWSGRIANAAWLACGRDTTGAPADPASQATCNPGDRPTGAEFYSVQWIDIAGGGQRWPTIDGPEYTANRAGDTRADWYETFDADLAINRGPENLPFGRDIGLQVRSCHSDRTGEPCLPIAEATTSATNPFRSCATSGGTPADQYSGPGNPNDPSNPNNQSDSPNGDYYYFGGGNCFQHWDALQGNYDNGIVNDGGANMQYATTYSYAHNIQARTVPYQFGHACSNMIPQGGEWYDDRSGGIRPSARCVMDLGGTPYLLDAGWVGLRQRGWSQWDADGGPAAPVAAGEISTFTDQRGGAACSGGRQTQLNPDGHAICVQTGTTTTPVGDYPTSRFYGPPGGSGSSLPHMRLPVMRQFDNGGDARASRWPFTAADPNGGNPSGAQTSQPAENWPFPYFTNTAWPECNFIDDYDPAPCTNNQAADGYVNGP